MTQPVPQALLSVFWTQIWLTQQFPVPHEPEQVPPHPSAAPPHLPEQAGTQHLWVLGLHTSPLPALQSRESLQPQAPLMQSLLVACPAQLRQLSPQCAGSLSGQSWQVLLLQVRLASQSPSL